MNKLISFFLILGLLTSCNSSSEKNESVEVEPVSEEISYLVLGDSYTIGESVEETGRWPVQLAEVLRKRGYEIRDPRIIAKTGWTTGDLLQAMNDQLEKNEKFDLVSVLIGVNNQYQGKSIEAYEEDLNTLFTRAIDLSKTGKENVFVVSIPDYGATPFGAENAEEIGKEIAEFNAVLERVAREYDLDFYNITPISKAATEEPDLVANDGLHPSGEMYRLWVEEFVDEVAEKLQN